MLINNNIINIHVFYYTYIIIICMYRSGMKPCNLSELHGNSNLEICSKCGQEVSVINVFYLLVLLLLLLFVVIIIYYYYYYYYYCYY